MSGPAVLPSQVESNPAQESTAGLVDSAGPTPGTRGVAKARSVRAFVAYRGRLADAVICCPEAAR